MNQSTSITIEHIHALAHTLHVLTGCFVSFTEAFGSRRHVDVAVQYDNGSMKLLYAAEEPIDDYQMTLDQMVEELDQMVEKARKEQEEAA